MSRKPAPASTWSRQPLPAGLRSFVLRAAEDRPGIYRMYGPGDELLYVGKSVRVRTRLLSYFRADAGEKAARIIQETARLAWEYVPNEFSALLRELRLIKSCNPRYNVEHRRKRRFAFVKITQEPAPRVIPTARMLPDGATYFGPFPRPHQLVLTLRDLTHVLGLRDCPGTVPVGFDDQLEFFARPRTPRCLRAEIGNCLAPCSGACSASEYERRTRLARRFLEGRSRTPLRLLRAEMEAAAAALDFEYAAQVRDRLARLDALQRELVAFRGRVEGLSFLYRIPGYKGEERLYLIRRGLVEREIPAPVGAEEKEKVAPLVREVFDSSRPRPHHPLTPQAAAEILLVARWFRLRPGEMRRTVPPAEWLESAAGRPVQGPHRRSAGATPGRRRILSSVTDSTFSRE